MVQTFMVIQCVNCETFQVHQVKKSSNKWTCKVCGTKQSVVKKYFEGQAAECRKHVQELNLKRGEFEKAKERLLMPPDEYGAFGQDNEPADDGLPGAQQPPYTVVQTKSKWSIFTSPHESDEEGDVDLGMDSPQEFEQTSKRAKRNTSLDSSASSCTSKKQGKHFVKGLKEITGSKSTYDLDSVDIGTESSKSIQRLTDSVAGLDSSSSVSQMTATSDDFMQGRRASSNTTPSTSKWHKFTSNNSSNLPSLTSFSTSDLNHL
ncbi:MRN complex-interacting protein-like isoform X2 [Dysidea avara]|uniref:MRN complex-interacting protein-like isoform X2 n=1 Tax=Dysidea avara TaxID=196820 RepID=UPI003323DE86